MVCAGSVTTTEEGCHTGQAKGRQYHIILIWVENEEKNKIKKYLFFTLHTRRTVLAAK